jgi:hypothetical protein
MYHDSKMRRMLSIFFVLFFTVGPLSAAFGDTEDASLPACCRRNGTHHCAASVQAAIAIAAASGQAVLTARTTCPCFPASVATNLRAPHALAATLLDDPALLAHPHSPAAARAAARQSQIRTRVSRGPPSSLRT